MSELIRLNDCITYLFKETMDELLFGTLYFHRPDSARHFSEIVEQVKRMTFVELEKIEFQLHELCLREKGRQVVASM